MQQRPHPQRSSERFGEQNEIVEVTEISSENQILQRTGDQILKGFVRDRVQQRLDEQSFVPQMVEQLEEVPKMVSQHGIQRRTVLPKLISARICGLSRVIEAAMVSSQDQNLQHAVEHDPVEADKTNLRSGFLSGWANGSGLSKCP